MGTMSKEFDTKVIEDADGNNVAVFIGTIGLSAREQAQTYLDNNKFNPDALGWTIKKGKVR